VTDLFPEIPAAAQPAVAKKKSRRPARWREFLVAAHLRAVARADLTLGPKPKATGAGRKYHEIIADHIIAEGQGEAFLKAVRRGRSTQQQNLRYQLLREVEKRMGDAVPRRRPDANTPDSLALKSPVRLELEVRFDGARWSD